MREAVYFSLINSHTLSTWSTLNCDIASNLNMNSSITIAFLTIIGLFVSANACTCLSSDLPDAYHNTFAKRFVKATPLSTFTNSNKRFYLLKIEQEYKACPPLPNRVLASTNLDSAACGIILTLNTPYIMPLNKLGLSAEINLCQVCSIKNFSCFPIFPSWKRLN